MEYQIKSQLSREGSLIYIYDSGGKETGLNSLYSPTKEINRFMNEIEDLQKKFVVIIGVGNGVVVEKLIQSDSLEKNVHFLIIEPYSEVILSDEIKTILNKNTKISFFYLNEFSAILFSRFLSKFTSISTSIHIHPNYLKANKSMIESIIQLLKEGARVKKILNNTEQKFAIDWIIEPLLNLKAMEKSNNIQQFRGGFSGETAILVSAGPSLQEKIPFIKKMKDSCHIFCVGPALRPLLKNNIKPDYVLSIDSSDINYETHFKDLNYDGTLIFETMSNHNIQKNHKGNLIVSKALSENVSPLLFHDNFGFPHSAPSVAIFTLMVIQYLGFSKVYMVGQDLALINGEYYSKGVKKHSGTNYSNVELLVDNNKGGKSATTRALKLFLEAFEIIINTFPENSLKIFNTSEYGAKIKGTEFIQTENIESLFGMKKMILAEGHALKPTQSVPVFIEAFLNDMNELKKSLKLHLEKIEEYLDKQKITKDEQLDLLVAFKEISGNKLVEEVLLSNLTFIFDNIINKVVYFDHKQKYSHEDLFGLLTELANLYEVLIKYIEEILSDSRIQKYI